MHSPHPRTFLAVCTSSLIGPDAAAGSPLTDLVGDLAPDEDVETVTLRGVDVADAAPDVLHRFRRNLDAATLETSTGLSAFDRTLLALARVVDARHEALEQSGGADDLRVIWVSALLASEYDRAHAYDVLGEYTEHVTLVGTDETHGATSGDVSVIRRALGMPGYEPACH